MATKRMNVLVYSGNGTTTESVRHCLFTLRRLLAPAYAVIPVTGHVLIKEPWMSTCALLVFPGGADLGYCRALNGEGNRRISHFVHTGGSYLGFCAGGYYGASRCEFEVHDPKMAVVGDRELAFYPGVCRGLAFAGFVYNSEAGARAAEVKINKSAFEEPSENLPETFRAYYNGGGTFVDADTFKDRGVEILAAYTEDLHVDSGRGKAAVVYRSVGQGHVVLTGPHPEFAPMNLTKPPNNQTYSDAVDSIAATDATRIAFMRMVLAKLSLKPNKEEHAVPSLSSLHLSSHKPSDIDDLTASWSDIFTVVDGRDYIKGDNDVFLVGPKDSAWSVQGLKRAVSGVVEVLPKAITSQNETKQSPNEAKPKTKEDDIRDCIRYTASSASSDQILDYDKVVKSIVPHAKDIPSSRETPSFNHEAYYANLKHHHQKLENYGAAFGTTLMYAEVVTSTNTLLEKNHSLLRLLPSGFTLAATTQIAGRGRGSNVWVAPPGALMFSTVIHHSFTLTQSAPIVFIQYIAALAIVHGIKNYAPGYDAVQVKLKWPNDIYAQLPGSPANPLVKVGGILVNSSYSGSSYSIVCGIGLNLSNPLPTTSLNHLLPPLNLKPFTPEKLLASILASFEALYSSFCRLGFSRDMEEQYYDSWLHGGQVVTLETHGDARARITGITRDWGLLLAEELGPGDRSTGRVISLQSDSNSFDFFRGLIKRKV